MIVNMVKRVKNLKSSKWASNQKEISENVSGIIGICDGMSNGVQVLKDLIIITSLM